MATKEIKRRFADSILSGRTQSDAARDAYAPEVLKPEHARTYGFRLSKDPWVIKFIESEQEKRNETRREKFAIEDDELHSEARRLMALAEKCGDLKLALRALRMLGELSGAFQKKARKPTAIKVTIEDYSSDE